MKLGVLRRKTYRTVFLGQAVSAFGTALVPVALAFAVLRAKHSPTDLGIVLAATEGSSLAFYLLGGVISDRFTRKRVMIAADCARAATQIGLGLLFIEGNTGLAGICLLAGAGGAATGLFMPAAQGLTPQLVDGDELHEANILQSSTTSLMLLLGPAVAGVLTVSVGGGWAIVIDGTTFVINALSLSSLPSAVANGDPEASILTQLRDGWQAFVARAWYVQVVCSVAVANLGAGIFITLGPVSAQHFGGAGAWAAILAVGAAGSALGTFAMMRTEPTYPLRTGALLLMLWACLPIAVGVRPPLVVQCLVAALGFFGMTASNALLLTSVQKVVPTELLSRVLSYDYFLSFLSVPLGLAVAGPLSALIGLKATLVGAGLVMLGVQVLTFAAPHVRGFRPLPTPLADVTTPPAADPDAQSLAAVDAEL